VIVGNLQKKHETFTEFGKPAFALDDASLRYYRLSRDGETTRKSSVNKFDFCSSYGQTNIFEDIAECHNLFLTHNALFRYFATRSDIMKKKYNFWAEQFEGRYFFDSDSDLLLAKVNPDVVFFDTTKIP